MEGARNEFRFLKIDPVWLNIERAKKWNPFIDVFVGHRSYMPDSQRGYFLEENLAHYFKAFSCPSISASSQRLSTNWIQ